MAFTINKTLVFIDSMQFMNSSLDMFVKNLPDNDFKIRSCHYFSSSELSRTMNQYLSYGGFKWLNQKEIDNFNVNSIGEISFDGYRVEVELDYPEMHNNYPLAPEKLNINHDMLSNYCSTIGNDYGIKIDNINKLVPNLGNRSKDVHRYRSLQLYLSLGMKFWGSKSFVS